MKSRFTPFSPMATEVSAALTVLLDIGHAFRVLNFRMLEYAGFKRTNGWTAVDTEAGIELPADGLRQTGGPVLIESLDSGFPPSWLGGILHGGEKVSLRFIQLPALYEDHA